MSEYFRCQNIYLFTKTTIIIIHTTSIYVNTSIVVNIGLKKRLFRRQKKTVKY